VTAAEVADGVVVIDFARNTDTPRSITLALPRWQHWTRTVVSDGMLPVEAGTRSAGGALDRVWTALEEGTGRKNRR